MTSTIKHLDLTEVPVGVTVQVATKSGSVYRITRQGDESPDGHVIGALYIDKSGPSVSDNEIPGNGELRGERSIEVGKRWMFNSYDGTEHNETSPVTSITVLDAE